MKKLALHWWILIGMVAGVVFGIVAAQLDAGRVDAFVQSRAEIRRGLGMEAQSMAYRLAEAKIEAAESKEFGAKALAPILEANPGLLERLRSARGVGARVGLLVQADPTIDQGLALREQHEEYQRARDEVGGARIWTGFVSDWVKPLGDLFMNLLKMIAVPLVLFSLVAGVASLNDTSKVGRIGGKTVALYIGTTAIAITIGLLVVNIIDPGGNISPDLQEKMRAANATKIGEKVADAEMVEGASFLQQLVNTVIPTNPFGSLSSGAMLQVVFFALMLGIALTRLDTKAADHVIRVFQLLSDAIIEMVLLIMKIAPFGVFALIAAVTADLGRDLAQLTELLGALAMYMLCVVLALFLHALIVYTAILKFMAKIPLGRFFRGMIPAQLLAFSSSSSGATLPVTMRCVEKNIGVDDEVSGFVLPLGATINMDGTGLYQGVAAIFIASFYKSLTLSDQLQIVLTATLASIGTAAVPGVGIVMLIIVLKQLGIPPEGIGLIMGVDRPLDMCRTVLNVTGDATVATAVAASEGLLHDPSKRPTEVEDLDAPLICDDPDGSDHPET